VTPYHGGSCFSWAECVEGKVSHGPRPETRIPSLPVVSESDPITLITQ
jgi:hypothetical protein